MRLRVASLRRMIKGKLHIEFGRQALSSYSDLELLWRYLRQRDLPRRLHAACATTGGDSPCSSWPSGTRARAGWSTRAMSHAIRCSRASAG